MLAPTHVLFSSLCAVAAAKCVGVSMDGAAWLALTLGSLAPDIDGRGAITRPGNLLGHLVKRDTRKLLNLLGTLVGSLVQLFAKHRGFFHWPILGVVMMVAGFLSELPWLIWFGFGYLTHILGDSLTLSGVPALAPFTERDLGLRLFRTGGVVELVFAAALTALGALWILPIQSISAG